MVRLWDAMTGADAGSLANPGAEDPLARYGDDPGARVYRACIACHALSADGGNRAGPSLAGLFGRKIASLPGYAYSPALQQLETVWSPETVSRLFDLGPHAYAPGTTMPQQRLGRADRAALIKFLETATRP